MSVSPLILTLDIGTTHIKTFIFGLDGRELYSRAADTPYNDHKRQDAAKVLEVCLDLSHKILTDLAAVNLQPQGLCISGAMHSLVPVDDKITPLDLALLWSDNEGASLASALRSTSHGKEIFNETGTPIHPMSVLIKIAWMRDAKPEIFKQAAFFISIKEFVYFHLTGCRQIDLSIASSTGLFGAISMSWSTAALDFAGVQANRLFAPVSPYHFETLLPELRTAWRLDTSFKVIIGASDGCLATLGAAPLEPGNISLSLGTSGALRSVIPSFKTDAAGNLFTYLLDENHYIIGGPSNNAGGVFTWFVSLFSSGKPGSEDYNRIINGAAAIAPGSDGLHFEPWLFGERAPYWNASLTAAFKNLTQAHTAGHMGRAVIEGVLYNIKTILKLIEINVKVKQLFAGGGLTRFPLWRQLLADILDKPILFGEDKEDSSAGAAIMGFKALGLIPQLESETAFHSHGFLVEPEPVVAATYAELYKTSITIAEVAR